MKEITLEKDLLLFYVQASSFPDGVQEAFMKLERLLPTKKGRKFFGLYEETKTGPIYKAAVLEQTLNEGKLYGCAYFTIEKGEYLTDTINNWTTKINEIGPAFDRLFATKRVKPESVSIEYYKSQNELVCMVKLKDKES